MIYITGDCHGDFTRFSNDNFQEQKEMCKDDTVIILGDFGGVWYQETSKHIKEENYWLDWLDKKTFTTVFIDGNHECINKNSDVLTENGWMNIEDLYNSNKKIKIANVDLKTHKLHFDLPIEKIKNYSETIINFNSSNYKQSVTPNHDVIVNGKKIKAKELIGKLLPQSFFKFRIKYDGNIDIDKRLIEILTTIVMDATIVDYSKYNPNSKKIRIQYHFKKERKIIYVQNILDDYGINYTIRKQKDGSTYINIYGDDARMLYKYLNFKKELPNYFKDMSLEQFKYLINGIVQTDATPVANRVVWRTTSENDLNIVEELCLKYNYDISINELGKDHSGYTKENAKFQYIVSFGHKDYEVIDSKYKVSITESVYNDYVYCFTMPHGTLITRYEKCPCITGNCFDRLYKFPIKEWNKGYVHEIRPSVLHLMRGEVFNIEGLLFFCMGGSSSHDISDGILEYDGWIKEAKKLDKQGKYRYRINHLSWWADELPSDEELNHGIARLDYCQDVDGVPTVDYILSHTPPASVLALLGWGDYEQDKLTKYLEDVRCNIRYKHHLFGHMHFDGYINDKDTCLYEQIVRIN